MTTNPEHFANRPEPLPVEIEADLIELDRRLGQAFDDAGTAPTGLADRVFSASSPFLAAPARPAPVERPMRFADVLAVRLSWTGRFALAASLALACIIGLRVMQRTIDPAGNLAGGPAGPGASLAFASILPPEAEQLLLDGVFAANDNSAFSSAMQTREMTYSDVLSELRLIEEAMGG